MLAAQVTGGTLAYGPSGRRVTILDNVSIKVEPGEILAVLGASGSGKSSLLRVLSGVEHLDTGTVKVLGGEPRDMLRCGRAAIASSDAPLLPWRTAHGNARLPLDLLGRERAAANASATALLEEVQIAAYGAQPLSVLSEGQTQRLRLAQALATDPDLLLLDEPFSNADEGLRQLLAQSILRYVNAAPARAALLVTHSSFEAAAIADRVIIVTGTPLREIYHERLPGKPTARKDADVMAIVTELQPHLIRAARLYRAPVAAA